MAGSHCLAPPHSPLYQPIEAPCMVRSIVQGYRGGSSNLECSTPSPPEATVFSFPTTEEKKHRCQNKRDQEMRQNDKVTTIEGNIQAQAIDDHLQQQRTMPQSSFRGFQSLLLRSDSSLDCFHSDARAPLPPWWKK